MPFLSELLGGPLVSSALTADAMSAASLGRRDDVSLTALDACLGVEGLPQSATGQTALFTGKNAPAAIGRHVTAFPGAQLAQILEAHSVFRSVAAANLTGTFANAFSKRYYELIAERRLRYSASVLAARAGGVALRDLEALRDGRAVSWDVHRDLLALPADEQVPEVVAVEAGAHLACLAAEYHFVLWETFLTDLAGHRRSELSPEDCLARVDGLLRGLVENLPPGTTVLVTSDHGNIEDMSHKRHTRNPVPLVAIGCDADAFGSLARLTEVTPRILEGLGAAAL